MSAFAGELEVFDDYAVMKIASTGTPSVILSRRSGCDGVSKDLAPQILLRRDVPGFFCSDVETTVSHDSELLTHEYQGRPDRELAHR
jgi:hypothetical protein